MSYTAAIRLLVNIMKFIDLFLIASASLFFTVAVASIYISANNEVVVQPIPVVYTPTVIVVPVVTGQIVVIR